MNEHSVDASKPQGMFAIRLGVRRRRSWSDAAKGRIVAESFVSGAVASQVARRHGISPQQLSTWRKAARTGVLNLLDDTTCQPEPEPTEQRHDDVASAPEGADKITLVQSRFPSSRQARAVLPRPGPRQKFVEARGRPEIDELGQHVGEISLRIDATEFAALDERGDAGPVLGAVIMTGKQCILAIEDKRADASLDDVGVELDTAVIEEPGEPVPVVERVADVLGDGRLGRHPRELLLEPGFERENERHTAFL